MVSLANRIKAVYPGDVARLNGRVDSAHEFLSQDRVLAVITVGPALLLFLAINVFPIAWAVSAGFFSISPFSPVWEYVGLSNFTAILNDGAFWMAVWRSLLFAIGSSIVQLVLGGGLALLLNRSFKFSNLASAIALLPYLIPTAILGFFALFMANGQFGIINHILTDLGLIESNIGWFSKSELVMGSLILTNSWKVTIFVTLLVLAKLQSIPENLYEAAQMSGASRYQQFRDITLPNLKGVIFIVLLLRGVWNFNKFDIIWVLTKGGPGSSSTTTSVYVYEQAFNLGNLGLAGAISSLLFILLVVVAMLYFYTVKPSKGVRAE
jgi:multiple sugar transport system permease protein